MWVRNENELDIHHFWFHERTFYCHKWRLHKMHWNELLFTFCLLKQVVIVGNGGVGKSSMIQRYCKGIYTKDYKKTIGVDFLERQIEWDFEKYYCFCRLSNKCLIVNLYFSCDVWFYGWRIDGEDIRIMLWDTAGQEEFDAITKAYYRGAQACVLAFSTTDRMSFEAIRHWKMKVI